MKIAIVIDHLDPKRGGQQIWAISLIKTLLGRGDDVHVLASGFGRSTLKLGFTAHEIRGAHHPLRFAAKTEQILRSLDLDVIHDLGNGSYCDIFNPRFGSRASAVRRKLELLPRHVQPLKKLLVATMPRYRAFARLAEKQYADDGRLIVAIANRVADDIRQDYAVDDDRIRVIHNGVDVQHFHPGLRDMFRRPQRQAWKIDEGTLLLMLAAHNLQIKGAPTLVRTMQRLKQSTDHPIHLVLIGSGNYGADMRGLIRRTGLGDRVTLAGPADDMRPWYAASDLLVYPTALDACSSVVLEAMACALPVITSDLAGSHELIVPEQNGFVMPSPQDDEYLVETVIRLLDPELRARIGKAARRRMLQQTIERNHQQYIDLYEEIAERKRLGLQPVNSPKSLQRAA